MKIMFVTQCKKYYKLTMRCTLLMGMLTIMACGGRGEAGQAPGSSSSSSSSSTSSSSSSSSSSSGFQQNTDAFGINQLYPSASNAGGWDSQHWADGIARIISDRDELDPSGWSQLRGSGTPVLSVMGDGRLQMSGGQPRLYINSYPNNSGDKNLAEQLFTNIEFTGYFRRLENTGEAYGGFIVGVRSGPLGHGSPGGNDCDATTYYSRLRNDGDWQFQKELKHPDSSVVLTKEIFSGDPLPLNQWLGIKYVVYTQADNSVQLKAWIDFSGGENGGDWTLLGEYTDSGNWNNDAEYGSVDATGCGYDENYVINPGNGVVFIRNTEGSGEYKWVTVREIEAY